MLKIKPQEVIDLCKHSHRFYKKETILFIEYGKIIYKIYDVSEKSFENLLKKVYEI